MSIVVYSPFHITENQTAINAAFEEYFFRQREGNKRFFLTYCNSPSVVIGRNQNPWLECNLHYLDVHNIPLVRRISGGGTVYHDSGNFNYCFIVPRTEYDPAQIVGIVQEALHRLGISAEMCERYSLWCQGRKIAGSAFFLTGKSAILHGCVLLQTDLRHLSNSLTVIKNGCRGDAVRSVVSPVMNAGELVPAISCNSLREAILEVLQEKGRLEQEKIIDSREMTADTEFAKFSAQYNSWEWTYGRTPAFVQTLQTQLDGKMRLVKFNIRHGRICDVAFENQDIRAFLRQKLIKFCLEQPYAGQLAETLHEVLPEGLNADEKLFIQDVCRQAAKLHVLPQEKQ